MIDFTHQLAEEYSRKIEAEGPSEDAVQHEAHEVLRGLTKLDISDALYDSLEEMRDAMLQVQETQLVGRIAVAAMWQYCERVARRKLEA